MSKTNHSKEISDAIYLIALQGFNYIAPLVVFPYLMVVLGADKFGYIGFSLSVINYLMLLVDFGFNLSATKRVALAKNNQDELNKIVISTLLAKIGLLVIGFLILLVFTFAIPQFRIYSNTMFILFLMVIANTFSFVWLFQGLGEIRVISIVNIISKLLILPITFVMVKSSSDYLNAAFIQSSIYIFSSIITCSIIYKRKYISNWVKVSKENIMVEIKSSYPIFISSTASSFYTSLFAVILGYYSNPSEVGKYTAAEKFMRAFCYLIFMPISQSFFPKISALSKINHTTSAILVRKIASIVTVFMVIVFAVMFFFSEPLTNFLGKGYHGTTQVFRIMALIPLFIGVGGILGQLGILALGEDVDRKKFQNVYLIAGIISIITIFSLVPTYHAIGASLSLFLTEFSVLIGMIWYSKKLLTIKKF